MKALAYFLLIASIVACNNNKYAKTETDTRETEDARFEREIAADMQRPTYRDSIDSVYIQHGFESFCDAVLRDNILSIEADVESQVKLGKNAIGSERFTNTVTEIYNGKYRRWLTENNLNNDDFKRDKLVMTLERESFCDAEIKEATSRARRQIYYKNGLKAPY